MTQRLERIIVGIDGSSGARRALEWGIVLASRAGAEVVAVHAVGLLAHLDDGLPEPSQAHLADLRRVFEDEWCAPLTGTDVIHRQVMLDGPPVLALLEAAERENAQVIVVGRRGAGNAADGLLGSTSHQLAERSKRPVLIVPPTGAN